MDEQYLLIKRMKLELRSMTELYNEDLEKYKKQVQTAPTSAPSSSSSSSSSSSDSLTTSGPIKHRQQTKISSVSLTNNLQQFLSDKLSSLAGLNIDKKQVIMEYHPTKGSHRKKKLNSKKDQNNSKKPKKKASSSSKKKKETEVSSSSSTEEKKKETEVSSSSSTEEFESDDNSSDLSSDSGFESEQEKTLTDHIKHMKIVAKPSTLRNQLTKGRLVIRKFEQGWSRGTVELDNRKSKPKDVNCAVKFTDEPKPLYQLLSLDEYSTRPREASKAGTWCFIEHLESHN